MKKYLIIFAILLMTIFVFAGKGKTHTITPVSPTNNATVSNPITFNWTESKSTQCTIKIYSDIKLTASIFESPKTKTGTYTFDNNVNGNLLHANTTYYWVVKSGKITSSTMTFTTDAAMPVELTSFNISVNNNTVNLNWSTATEINNYGFAVERSSDNKNYTKIGFVKGNGNTNSPKNYSFTDQPTGGNTFSYRLKQIDNSGEFVYSDVISVTIDNNNSITLSNNYPNPFNPSTAIKFYVPENMNVSVIVYNILGETVNTLTQGMQTAGYHIVYWNGKDNYGSSVASGIYLYRIIAGNYTETKKMNLLK